MATQLPSCHGSGTAPLSHAADVAWVQEKKVNGVVQSRKPAKKQTKRAEDEGLSAYLCAQICEHQVGISVNLLLLLFLTHIFFPRARRRTSKFFHLSYFNPETQLYGCGTDDLAYVALWMVIFTGARVLVMEYILRPLAQLGGIRSRKGVVRFQEQAWLICYCVCSWSLGMYIMYNSEYWLNLHGMWQGWPFREISGLCKFYYLIQWAFYMQQILVVNIEEKRKDYAQMFTHHIFTTALLFLSYGYYHTRVGTVILCIMDLVDIILPTAKLLKYLGYSNVCDIGFGLFVVAWVFTRQIFYPMICWSIYAHAPVDMAPGCYFNDGSFVPASDTARYESLGGNLIWHNLLKAYTDRNGHICWTPTIRYSFLALLLALQGIILLWFAMIIKVVYKVISGQGADDVRSDDEGDEEVEDEMQRQHVSPLITPVEQEVGVESLHFVSRKNSTHNGARRNQRKSRSGSSRASGLSIPGHGDHKELLGRIGCDKPT